MVILFAKYPEEGRVKTRLGAGIGADKACRIYCALLRFLVEQFKGSELPAAICLAPETLPRSAAGDPVKAGRQLAARLSIDIDLPVSFQTGHDLGERMARALFNSASERTVLIGTDFPFTSPGFLAHALEGLKDYPFTFGPTEDGGYYLTGLNRSLLNQNRKSGGLDRLFEVFSGSKGIDSASALYRQIFKGIDWSTSNVMQQQNENLDRARYKRRLLPVGRDIDQVDDLSDFTSQPAELHSFFKEVLLKYDGLDLLDRYHLLQDELATLL